MLETGSWSLQEEQWRKENIALLFKERCLQITRSSQDNKLSITIIVILWALLMEPQSLSLRVSNLSINQGMTDNYTEREPWRGEKTTLDMLISQSFSSLWLSRISCRHHKRTFEEGHEEEQREDAEIARDSKGERRNIFASKIKCFNNQTVESDKCHLLSLCKLFISPSQFLKIYWSFIMKRNHIQLCRWFIH